MVYMGMRGIWQRSSRNWHREATVGLRGMTANKVHGRALITTHGRHSGKKQQQQQNQFKAADLNPVMFMNTTQCSPTLEHKRESGKRKLKEPRGTTAEQDTSSKGAAVWMGAPVGERGRE